MDAGLKLNVLVVDDNHVNRILISKVLQKWGISADFAENGAEAIKKLEDNQKYDVVLMDVYMPGMGGIEATRIIRTKPELYFQQVPIVALTASIAANQQSVIYDAGMNDFISKPFEAKALYEKLASYCK